VEAGVEGNADLAYAADVAETLAGRIGPRRPCSKNEREAAELIAGELTEAGLAARLESFQGPATRAVDRGEADAQGASDQP